MSLPAAGLPLGEAEHREVTDFLFLEAELLDGGSFREWLSLLTEDIRYRVFAPVVTLGGSAAAAEERRMPLFDEDIRSLRARVAQLATPDFTIAENPRSIDRRYVANVRAFREADHIAVRTNLLLRRARGVGTEPHLLSTSRRDTLRRIDGSLRLSSRTVQLDDAIVGARSVSVFF